MRACTSVVTVWLCGECVQSILAILTIAMFCASLGLARRAARGALGAGVLVAAHELTSRHQCSTLGSHSTRSPLQLPPIGLGLWKSGPGEVHGAVKNALLFGCRLLDGAAAYGNEAEVGAAIAEAISERVVSREDLWVVSKLFNTHHVWGSDRSRPAEALDQTLRDLRLAFLDLFLMHWPVAFEQKDLSLLAGGLRLADGTPNPRLVMRVEFIETWREMLKLKRSGKVRHVGVSNFSLEMLQELLREFPDDPPAVNQVELHPYLAQPELVDFCKKHGIALMAYSPLGSADSYSGRSFPAKGTGPFECPGGGSPLLQNALVQKIADGHGVTTAQVLIAWSAAQGVTPLPKSVQEHRISENLSALSACKLTENDLTELATLDCGFRYSIGYMAGLFDCPNAPWFRKGESTLRWAAEKLGLVSKPK